MGNQSRSFINSQPSITNRQSVAFSAATASCFAIQHHLAKEVFDESMLPVVYINSSATFMKNYFMAQKAIQKKDQIIWPSRTVPFMAIDDIGEVAAKVLLSGDRRHIGAFHTINNGHDLLDAFGAARVMSEFWGKRIDAVDDKEVFVSEYRHLMGESLCNRLWDFLKFEKNHEVFWSLNNFAERILGRKPKNLAQWVQENKAAFVV